MSERLLGLLGGVPNPFAQVRVGSAWETVAADVESVNATAFGRCQRIVAAVRDTRTSHGLLLHGLAGTGKTHLLARLRRHLIDNELGWFVYVPPVTAPDRFHRHVLQFLAGDVLRTARQGTAATQLETAVARHFMADAVAPVAETARWWSEVRQAHSAGPELRRYLQSVLDPVTEALGLDASVMRILAAHLSGVHRLTAREWLMGRALPEADLADLDVAIAPDDEDSARRAIHTLIQVAGQDLVVLFAFDQIEGLQRTPDDREPLVAFGNGVAGLLDSLSNVVVVTCAQISYLPTLEAALGSALYDGRIAENQGSLSAVDGETALILAVDRLRRCVDLQQIRTALSGSALPGIEDEAWPLRSSDISAIALAGSLPARTLLMRCRELFEERREEILRGLGQHQAPAPPPERPSPPTPPPVNALDDLVATEIATQAAQPAGIDSGVYEDGLVRAAQLCAPVGVSLQPSRIRDVELEVRGGRSARVGVSICNAENMRSLAARLGHLLNALDTQGLDSLVLVRDARLPISRTAAVTNARLEQLQARGCVLARPGAEAYQALAAVRKLLADAAAGDLTLDGEVVAPQALKDWLAHQMPVPARDLVEQVLGAGPEAEPPALAALQALLQEEYLLELEAAASQLAVPLEAAREAARMNPELVGLLVGPPEVVFLHANGMLRG